MEKASELIHFVESGSGSSLGSVQIGAAVGSAEYLVFDPLLEPRPEASQYSPSRIVYERHEGIDHDQQYQQRNEGRNGPRGQDPVKNHDHEKRTDQPEQSVDEAQEHRKIHEVSKVVKYPA